nr:MAG TPA: hypothetical protein [Caudoviricetes sp.]
MFCSQNKCKGNLLVSIVQEFLPISFKKVSNNI